MIRSPRMLPLWGSLGLVLSGCQWFPPCSPEESAEPTITEPSPTTEPDPKSKPTQTEPPPTCDPLDLPAYAQEPDLTCVNELQQGSFTPVEEWSITEFKEFPDSRNVMMAPVAYPLTATSTSSVVAVVTYSGSSWLSAGVIRVLAGDGSGVLWSNADVAVQGTGQLAAADIDQDGVTELLAVTVSLSDKDGFGRRLVALDDTGAVEWRSAPLPSVISCNSTSPAVADLDGNGDPEIIVGAHILSSSGELLATGTQGIGLCHSFAVDLDGDGRQEVVAGNALYDIDGKDLWGASELDGYPAVGNFDDDDDGEVVVVDIQGVVRLHDTDGKRLWASDFGVGQGPPTVADFDGDGLPEVGVAGTSTYTVLDTDGKVLWTRSTTDASSGRTGSSVFDFEGDGVAEVVYADEQTVWVFSGVDGTVKLDDDTHTSWTWTEYSIVVDIDGDGQAEIVTPRGSIGGSTSGAVFGVSVIGDADESWVPARQIWNQFSYHIDNIDDDGSVPAKPEPSWLSHNSFRSGDLRVAPGLEAPDLEIVTVEACEDECAADRLLLDVQVGNVGATGLSFGATLTVTGTRSDGSAVAIAEDVIDLAEAGEILEGWRFEVEGADVQELVSITAELTSPDLECSESNNLVVLDGPFCS